MELTPDIIKDLRLKLSPTDKPISQTALGALIGLGIRPIQRFESGLPPTGSAEVLLKLLCRDPDGMRRRIEGFD